MIDFTKLTFEQKKILNEFRKRMEGVESDYLNEDPGMFYRFLKARDFDLEKAEKMLRKHINWRKSFQVPSILRDFKPREFFRKYVEPSLLGFDKDGDLIYYMAMGKVDGKEVWNCAKVNDYMNYWIWFSERARTLLLKILEKRENYVPQLSFIIDLGGLTLANAIAKESYEITIRATRILQDNYPEGLKIIYMINCPSYYVVIFSILKATMSHAMLQKFHVYGQDGWKEKLLENIDADVLPAFLGGSRTDPDGNPLCNTFVCHGGTIPPSHFLTVEDRDFKDRKLITNLCVPKSDKKKIYISVEDEGSVIHWEFRMKNRDIGFGLFFQEKEELIEILPIQKFDTIDGVEEGAFTAQFPGKYVIVFDNSYSWIFSKEIEYCIEVIRPELSS